MSSCARASLLALLLWAALLWLSAPPPAAQAQDDDFEEDEDFGPGSFDPEDGEVVDDGGSPFGRRFRSSFRGGAGEGASGPPPEDDPEAGDLPAFEDDPEAGGLPPLDDDPQAGAPPPMEGDDGGDALPPIEASEGDELPPLEEEPTDEEAPELRLLVSAGLGVGSRGFQRPTFRGLQKLPDTPFAAAHVALRTRLWPDDAFAFDVLLVYQTSIAAAVREEPLFAQPQDVDVRSSRGELGVGPTFRLGEAADALAVSILAGLAMRDFWPTEDQYQTRRHTLGGPFVRGELIVPLAGGVANLRVGPELQWVPFMSERLRKDGVIGDGIAVGGQLSVNATLTERLGIGFEFRESRVYASSEGPLFIDVERFVTATLTGRY